MSVSACRCVSEFSVDSILGKFLIASETKRVIQDQNLLQNDPYHTKPVGKFLTSIQCHILSRNNDPLP